MSHPNAISVTLSPKALRFVIDAIAFQQAHFRRQLASGELDEDGAADASNDWALLESIREELEQRL